MRLRSNPGRSQATRLAGPHAVAHGVGNDPALTNLQVIALSQDHGHHGIRVNPENTGRRGGCSQVFAFRLDQLGKIGEGLPLCERPVMRE